MTGMFKAGYKAYVNGGRRKRLLTHIGRYTWEYYDGYEPFDYLTDEQKADWLTGVQYGMDERNECRSIPIKEPKELNKKSGIRKAHRAEMTPKIIELLWTKISMCEICRRLKISKTFLLNTIKRANDPELIKFRKSIRKYNKRK